jgi:[CysO sulfur-carrier protein]-S-L-cysteine hydrolase
MYREYLTKSGLRVLLPEQVFEEMTRVCRRYYPKESGGVLVGRVEDGATAVVELMIVPKWFYSTPIFFSRREAYINRQLNKIWKETDGKSHYLGEWHCHPNLTSQYSGTDYKTMVSIAGDSDNRMENPIMMIIGYKPPEFKETVYVYLDGTLHTYERKQ